MATGTGPLVEQDILNKVWNPGGTQGGTSDSITVTNNPGTAVMGTVAIGGGGAFLGSGTVQAGTGPNALVVVQPAFRQFVLDTTTTAVSSATGTTTTGLGGYKHAQIYVRYSSMTGTASSVSMFVDSRLDGTNWVNLGRFQDIASATGATAAQMMLLQKGPVATTANIIDAGGVIGLVLPPNIVADAGEGTVRLLGWGDDLRIRRNVSGGTTAPIFTYTVTVNLTS